MSRRRPPWIRLVPFLALGAIVLAGCGGSEPADEPAEAGGCPPVESTEVAAEAPDTSGQPPSELQVQQLAPPPGEACPAVETGDVVAVHYTGRAWSNGEVFDSSRDRGQPFAFEVGAGEVIAGWDDGIAGLRVGEQARLTIPPGQAYGEQGAPPAIGPNETLVFDVQVMDILEQPTGAPTEG